MGSETPQNDQADGTSSNDLPSTVAAKTTQSSANTNRVTRLVTIACTFAALLAGGSYFATTYPVNEAKASLLDHKLEIAQEWITFAQNIPFVKKSQIHFLTARLERRKGNYRQMSSYLDLAQDAGYDPEMITRERILASAQSANLDKARPHLSKLLEDPRGDEREICEAYIIGFLQFQLNDSAIQLVQAWQQDFPSDARPHYLEGIIYKSMNVNKGAEQCFLNALKVDPKYYAAAMEVAEVLLELKNTERALKYLKLAEEDPLLLIDSYVAQAHCYRMLGQADKAEKILRVVLQKTPNHYAASNELGRILVVDRRYAEAIPLLQPIVDNDELLTDPRQSLAMALRGEGRLEEAQAHFDVVGNIKDNLATANQIVETIGSGPDSIHDRLTVAQLFWKYGSEQDAMVWMRTAYQLNPKHLPTLEFMLTYYQEKVKANPELQSQVIKFEREIAFAKAQANRTVNDGTATTDPEPSASKTSIQPEQNQAIDTVPAPSTN
ncbi:MAG: tetratricopeptide repeat protein [Planctomycetaceae bacterium]|jgi:tetratricopeptide (TPR) repeat protein|nr:tetratricopeptide repeat protein [Planctomycetaceae bacterium]